MKHTKSFFSSLSIGTTSCEVIKCEQDRYYFDLDSCECIPEAPCSITCNKGDILDEVACRCDIADVFCFDTKCEDNYDIDFDNCKCIPKPIPSPPCTITCKMGDFLDEVACQCLNIGPCFGKICENDRYLDLDSCQCVRYPSQANKCLKLQKLKI